MHRTRATSTSSSEMEGRNVRKGEKKCGSCDKLCRENDKSLVCKGCDRYFHITCQKVSEAKYEVLVADSQCNTPSIMWFCNSSCNFFAAKVMGSMVEMRKEIDSVKARVDSLSANVGKIDTRVLEIDSGMLTEEHNEAIRKVVKEEIDEVAAGGQIGASTGTDQLDFKDKVNGFVTESIGEIRERDFRRRNFIVHNIPMSSSKEIQKRIKYDQKCVEQLCKEGLNLKENLEIKKIVRLGKKDDKKRPTRVFTTSPEEASKVFRAKGNLSEKEKFKNVQIVQDRTPLEREELKRLHILKEQKQTTSDRMGEQVTWTVWRGRLVCKEKKAEDAEAEDQEEEEEEEDPDSKTVWG